MEYKEMLTQLVGKFLDSKKKYLTEINSGEYFEEIYLETRKNVSDFIMNDIPQEFRNMSTINSEKFLYYFSSLTMMINVEFSVETDIENPHQRSVTIVDELDNNLIDIELLDYSIVDLVNDEKLSRYSLALVRSAIKKIYELRADEEQEGNMRFYMSNDQFVTTDFVYEENNLKVDPYKYTPEDEQEDMNNLEDSFDSLPDDFEGDSELSREWNESAFALHEDFSVNFMIAFKKEYSLDVALGLNFDKMYVEFINAFRKLEEKYHPASKLVKEKPIDMFLYFCDHIINIDVNAVKLNENFSLKRVCANIGNALAIDNTHFEVDNYGLLKYNDFTMDELLSKLKIVNFVNLEKLYEDVKTIYLFRQSI